MNDFWGVLVALIGLFLFLSGFNKSENVVYKLMVARSRLLWKDHVHTFYVFVGLILMAVSMLFFFNIF
jgi:hypothetical protein